MQLNLEKIQLWVNHLKSLTTLSSGLIVALVAILNLVIENPKYIFLAAISMAVFCISILGSVLSQMLLINIKLLSGEELQQTLKSTLGLSLFVANMGFVCAVLFLTIFGVANIINAN